VRSDPTRSAHGYRRDRLSQFDTGVRYQLWHALALIAVVFVSSFSRPFVRWTGVSRCIPSRRRFSCDPVLTGWLFVVGVSSSREAFTRLPWRVTADGLPLRGVALLLGWLALVIAVLTM
jgi:uncharacterized membrane protein YgdD (TMEM256/DUF423 family)